MMRYPVILQPDEPGFAVSFSDIPEALTSGQTEAEAMEMAQDALATALEFYFDDGRPVPLPGKVELGQRYVELPASLAAKVLLLNQMLADKVRPADLARRMGKLPQEVTRILDLKHATKIDAIQDALRALGQELVISSRVSEG